MDWTKLDRWHSNRFCKCPGTFVAKMEGFEYRGIPFRRVTTRLINSLKVDKELLETKLSSAMGILARYTGRSELEIAGLLEEERESDPAGDRGDELLRADERGSQE